MTASMLINNGQESSSAILCATERSNSSINCMSARSAIKYLKQRIVVRLEEIVCMGGTELHLLFDRGVVLSE
jgi:hypothetical protein